MEDSRLEPKNDSKQESKGLKDKISELRDLILVVPPVFLCVSFLFNYLYFSALEIPFEKLPLSTIDYVASINILIPLLITSLISFLPLYLFVNFLKNILDKSDNNLEGNKLILSISFIMPTIGIFLLLIEIFPVAQYIYTYPKITSILAFTFFCTTIALSNNYFIKLSCITCIFIFFILTVSTFVAFDNYKSVSSDISISGNQYFVMRNFNSGFLLRVPNKNELVFLTTSGVKINFKQPEGFQNRISPKGN